jgi:hypothetical protein
MELLTSSRYRRYLTLTDTGQVRLDPQAIRQAQRLDGKGVLLTNDDTLSIQDVALAYQSLMVIERCFRSLKRGQVYLGRRVRDWRGTRLTGRPVSSPSPSELLVRFSLKQLTR